MKNVKAKLQEITNRYISVLDGDVVRQNLSKGLTFSKEDRSINVRRVGWVASKITKHNGIVLCANIAPYKDDRDYNKSIIDNYIEIFVDTPLEICEKRDCKGLYKLARNGIIKQFTGISDPFEADQNSDIVVKPDLLEKQVDQVINYVKLNGLI